MTPMQSLKPQFDSFKKVLPDLFIEAALNHAEPDDSYISFCGDKSFKKGVKSDFIKIFKLQYDDGTGYSIAFSFNYIDTDTPTVRASLKKGVLNARFYKTDYMTVQDCRTLMNNFIEKASTLDEKKLRVADFVELFHSEFALTGKTPKPVKFK